MRKWLADLTPIREIPAYRRLWSASAISNIGQQMAALAVGLQVYQLTQSSWMVGLVGLFQFVPLVILGLWGGVVSDVHDRRLVGMYSAVAMVFTAGAFTLQALLGGTNVTLLYVLIAVQSAVWAIGSPARQAIMPRIVPTELLPAANALSGLSWNVGFAIGPLLGGAVIAATDNLAWAYGVDTLLFLGMLYAMFRLPPLPPSIENAKVNIAAVGDGLRFLRGKRNVQMTFYIDIVAMVFGMPRALFPALATMWYLDSGLPTATVLGLLAAGPTIGAALSGVFSGPLQHVRRQGLAVFVSVVVWGVAIAGFGLTRNLWFALVLLAIAGAADNVSAVFRSTMLQSAVPDEYRGRLQGVFTVVVAGGPRLGDVEAGAVARWFGEAASAVSGGIICVVLAVALMLWRSDFLRYDARHPVP